MNDLTDRERSRFAEEDYRLNRTKIQEIPLDQIEELAYEPAELQERHDSELVESIRRNGLQSPLLVARPCQNAKFVPIAGGNARIRSLRRLEAELDEKVGVTVPCVVVAWPGALKARLAHVVANEVKKKVSFIRQARCLVHLIDAYGANNKGRSTTIREAVKVLNGGGYAIDLSTYWHMDYAVRRLLPHLPRMLESASHRDIRQIRSIERRFCDHWKQKGFEINKFQSLFNVLCSSLDREGLTVSELENGLQESLPDLDIPREESQVVNGIHHNETPVSHTCQSKSADSFTPAHTTSSAGSVGDVPLPRSVDRDVTERTIADSPIEPFHSKSDIASTRPFGRPVFAKLRIEACKFAVELDELFQLGGCIHEARAEVTGFRVSRLQSDSLDWRQIAMWEYLVAFSTDCKDLPFEVLSASLWGTMKSHEWRVFTQLWDIARELQVAALTAEEGRVAKLSNDPRIADVA